ncbi:MAG TPA: NUDIX hydrolase [Acidimicrobiia bacterium]|nr:NUDIX hydrolase [Acidimicrobiia bacterium]
MSEFRVVASTDIAEAGFLRLSRDEVVAPTGESFTRHVVHHPGAVVVVPVEADGESTLMVRQYRVAVRRTLLESPAGKTDVDGEPPAVTAQRELEEEIGRRAGRLVALATCFNSPGFTDELTHIYAGLDLTEIPHARVGPEEAAMTIESVPLREIDALVAAGEVMHATSIIGLQLTRRYLAGEYQPIAS